MAIARLANANFGIDVLKTGSLYRIWWDKGRHKYKSVDVSHAELHQLVVMFGSVFGGSRNREEAEKFIGQRGPRRSE